MSLTVVEFHQKRIAEAILRLTDEEASRARMTKVEAKELLDKLAEKELKEMREKI